MKGDREHAIADFREAKRRYPFFAVASQQELKALGAEPDTQQGVLDLLK
jgi:hypothetical protein